MAEHAPEKSVGDRYRIEKAEKPRENGTELF